jgi:hypothetical protein
MTHRLWPILFVGAVLAYAGRGMAAEVGADATAAEAPQAPPRASVRHFTDAPLGIEVRTGIATSVGLLGVVGEYTPFDVVTVGGGIGTNGRGPVWDVHARFRIYQMEPLNGLLRAVTLETSFSRGKYASLRFLDVFSSLCEGDPSDPNGNCYNPTFVPAEVSWWQVELGWETRFRSGISLRPSLGFAIALNTPDWQCETNAGPGVCGDRASRPGAFIPVLALGIGYAPAWR